MSTTHQIRDRDRSRQRSVDRYAEASASQVETPSTTAAGTKRLFSNRQSRLSYNSEDHGENDDHQSEDTGESYSEKRRRGIDWPLSNPSPLRGRYNSRDNSPPSSRPANHKKRPSKFQEGSMNDRVSQKPPITYLDTDEFLEAKYQGERMANGRKSRPHTFPHHPNSSLSVDTDISRHSSIFRFGKSIAASFNPSNWKIWSKSQPEPEEDGEAAQQRILNERQEKAERIYKELKQSGRFRDAQIPNQSYGRFGDKTLVTKHDSGIVMEETGRNSRMSVDSGKTREEKRMGMVFLEPPRLLGNQESASPGSNTGSRNRSSTSSPVKQSLHFKKPSLSNMKRAFKDESLVDVSNNGEHRARRIPSRKDLQKQQKLVKRVSDLEGKLEAARRQLNESLATPIPTKMPQKVGRSRFVPGAMPSLPSERLLSGYIESEGELGCDEADEEIGKAVSFDEFRDAPSAVDSKNGKDSSAMKPSPLWADKPLPPLAASHHDQAVQSIELDDGGIDQTHVALTSREQSAGSNAFLPSNYEQEHGMAEDDRRAESDSNQEFTPNVVMAENKKRKSRFDEAFDGGNYKTTSDTSSEPSSLSKKTIPRKKVAVSNTRKLQKTLPSASAPPKYPPPPPPTAVQTSTAHVSSESTPSHEPPSKTVKTSQDADPSSTNHTQDSPQRRNTLKSKRAPSATSSSSNRPARTRTSQRQPQVRQSVSPPPSSSFTGLQYAKPVNTSASNGQSSSYSHRGERDAATSNSESIPPMPKLPRAVRLPSGEVINVNPPPISDPAAGHFSALTSSSASRGSKLVKTRRERKAIEVAEGEKRDLPKSGTVESESLGREPETKDLSKTQISKSGSKASFEWPEDVF